MSKKIKKLNKHRPKQKKQNPSQKSLKKFSSNHLKSDEYFNQGKQFFTSGNFSEAIESFKMAHQINPNQEGIIFNLGVAYEKINNLENAKLCFKKALGINPSCPEIWYMLGFVNFKLTNNNEAIEAFQKLAKLSPMDVRVYHSLCTIFTNIGRFEEAISAGEKALSINSKHYPTLLPLGNAYSKSKNNKEKAMECYERLIDYTPNDSMLLSNMGGTYCDLGHTEKAEKCLLKAIEIYPEYPAAHTNLAALYIRNGQLSKAADISFKTLQFDPPVYLSYSNLATIFRNQGYPDKEAEYLQKFLKHNPEDVENMLSLAFALGQCGKIDEKIEAFTQAIKIGGPNLNALMGTAKIFSANNLHKDALIFSLKALEFYPNYPQINYFSSMIYANLDQPEKEIEYLEKAIEAEADCSDMHFYLGNAFNKAGQYDKAIDSYKKSAQLDPYFPNLNLNLFLSLKSVESTEEAEFVIDNFHEYSPDIANSFTEMGLALESREQAFLTCSHCGRNPAAHQCPACTKGICQLCCAIQWNKNICSNCPNFPSLEPLNVKKEKFHIFLLLGQSNMEGTVNELLTPLNLDNRIFEYSEATKVWEPMQRGTSLGVSFAQKILLEHTDISIGFINLALGGSRLLRWMPPDGHLYLKTIEIAKNASNHGVIKGILWHQGESDAQDMITAQSYHENFCKFVQALRENLNSKKLPLIAGELGRFLKNNPIFGPFCLINEAFHRAASKDHNIAVVPSEGLYSDFRNDNLHFSPKSLKKLGQRYAEAYLDMQKTATMDA